MAIDFPNSPSTNDTHTVNGRTYVWTGDYWKVSGTAARGLSLAISDTAPTSPTQGDLWFESDTGRTYTYYDGFWVELGNTAQTLSTYIVDADTDTKIQVEETSDDDTIRFDTAGVERATIGPSGDVTVFESLTVGGGASVSGSLTGPTISTVQSDITTLETDVTNINELQQNAQTASYTLALSDAGKLVKMDVASANNLTVPPNSSVAFPIGTQILVLWQGAGQTTIVAGSGVNIYSKDGNVKLSARWCVATLIKLNTDNWLLVGDLSA